MTRFLPHSLFGQTMLVLLAGLVVSHAVGSWIYTADREQAVRAVGGLAAAQRVANLTRLVQDTPQDWRPRIVAALSDRTFQVALTSEPPTFAASPVPVAAAIRDFLVDQLALEPARYPRVAASSPVGPPVEHRHPMGGRGPFMHRFGEFGGFSGFGAFRQLQVAVPLPDRQWLTFATALPDTGPAFSRQFLISMAVMAVIIIAVSAWVVRRVTAPLASLAMAADRLGRDVAAPPLPETGSIETRQASRAFNDMQRRLRSLIDNRTRLLAAISHDLRTPLTLLRLRAETVQDVREREKMLSTIAEMDAMLGATLQFARDDASDEPRRATDLSALLQSVADDLADAGLPVSVAPSAPIVVQCRPLALKRAITNLLDNAVKYGTKAHAAIERTPAAARITIDDEGPGLPEAELARVFEPFYRVEASRSRETGGVGLGLAIARSIVDAHGGELTLANRPAGGLRACITLPLA